MNYAKLNGNYSQNSSSQLITNAVSWTEICRQSTKNLKCKIKKNVTMRFQNNILQ